jgi:hypothetical protein
VSLVSRQPFTDRPSQAFPAGSIISNIYSTSVASPGYDSPSQSDRSIRMSLQPRVSVPSWSFPRAEGKGLMFLPTYPSAPETATASSRPRALPPSVRVALVCLFPLPAMWCPWFRKRGSGKRQTKSYMRQNQGRKAKAFYVPHDTTVPRCAARADGRRGCDGCKEREGQTTRYRGTAPG